MNIVIAGAGKVGYFLARELMEDNEVTLIDSNEQTIQNNENTLDVLNIYGDVENPYTYRNIQKDIDLFIAVTDSDEVNLLSSLIIDNIVNVKEKIVRLKNEFFMSEDIKTKLNITEMITPAANVARTFNHLIDFPHANNIKTFDYTKAVLISARVHEEFYPTTILSFLDKFENRLIIAGIERGDEFFIPHEEDLIQQNDLVYFFTFSSYMDKIRTNICNKDYKQSIKNCIIYGASQLGIEIAKTLLQKGINIKLIDLDIEKCKIANTILKDKVEVLKNSYNQDIYLENHAEDINIFIAATNNDEFNLTKCIEAKEKGIEKVIGIHNNNQHAKIMRKFGIEVIRGEKMNAFYSILEKITSSKIITHRAFCGGAGNVYLRKVFPNTSLIETKLPLNDKIYKLGIFYIQRDKKFFSYKSIEKFEENDTIIVFTADENSKQVINWLKQ